MKLTKTLTRSMAAAAVLLTLPSVALAQAGGANGQLIQMVIMFGGIGLVMYMFMIRPQRRRERDRQDMIQNSQAGDHLLLNSGFKVKLKHKDERFFRVELADGVIAEVDPNAVTANTTAMEKRANEAAERAEAKKAGRNRNN
ncbi:MAG: preprotein translocase subunit YajC [Alphaproteobacteria bacterium]|jgi:preprotein translocase subunit YajC